MVAYFSAPLILRDVRRRKKREPVMRTSTADERARPSVKTHFSGYQQQNKEAKNIHTVKSALNSVYVCNCILEI